MKPEFLSSEMLSDCPGPLNYLLSLPQHSTLLPSQILPPVHVPHGFLLLRCRPEYQFYLKMLQKQKEVAVGGMTKPGSQRVAAKTSTGELVNEKQLSAESNAGGHPFCSIFSEAESELLAAGSFKISSLFSLCHPPNILSVDVSHHQAQRTVNAPCGAERSISLSGKCRESGLDAKWGEREADLHAYHCGHAAESACLVLTGRTLPAR
ncbi:unnamed protein product [Rangifer tarandus platyrhynchus]|uniref:Uncharacterized protein n=1 Tax=Rangifer tarandus platyrhynchus TaxID=3082113 RepID=A0ABN8YJU0_RANTA|nr:unnamed protein product [Rangifer tarandus platyrhynchus]